MGDQEMDPTLERKFKGHKDTVSSINFNPNDDKLVSGSLDSTIVLWNLDSKARSYKFDGHREAVTDVTFSPSGKLIASVSRDRSVRLWTPSVTGSTGEFRAHSQTVRSVQFTSDDGKLLTASDDKIIKLWSVCRQKFISSFVGHNNWVRCARLSNDDSVIVSCSDDKTIKLWNIDGGECIHTFSEKNGSAQHVAWHPTGCYIAVALTNGNVKLYDTRTHALLQHYKLHDAAATQLNFHPSGSYLVTSGKDNKVKILDLAEGHPIYTINGHAGPVTAVAFSTSGDYFATGGEDKQVFIWKSNFPLLKDINTKGSSEAIQSAKPDIMVNGSKCNNDQGTKDFKWSRNVPVNLYQFHVIREDVEEYDCSKSLNSDLEESQEINRDHSAIRNTVGHTSHIPRKPPTPRSVEFPKLCRRVNDYLLGMISLKNDEVCYTTGTIEWVSRKKNYCSDLNISPELQRKKQKLYTKKSYVDKNVGLNSCECLNVIPTINTIVDHLHALHDTVEIVDERLYLVENVLQNNA